MTNNSQIAQDFAVSLDQEKIVDLKPAFKERESKLVRIIEAIRELKKTSAWSTLKIELFDGLTESLERDLRSEAKKDQPDPSKLNRIAGQLTWAERYSDLDKFEVGKLVELKGIRKNLYGTEHNA